VGSDEEKAAYRAASLGFLVPGVLMTPIGALSRPASMAARTRAQNASSMRFIRRDWIPLSSPIVHEQKRAPRVIHQGAQPQEEKPCLSP